MHLSPDTDKSTDFFCQHEKDKREKEKAIVINKSLSVKFFNECTRKLHSFQHGHKLVTHVYAEKERNDVAVRIRQRNQNV